MEKLEARFGKSPVHVKTPRGIHLYYASGGRRLNLRGEGLPVDVKTGASSYVVGPGSVRPDGGEYVMVKGDLRTAQLSQIKALETLRQVALARSHIEVGRRNKEGSEPIQSNGDLARHSISHASSI